MSTKPIHVGDVNGQRLRFFRSPLDGPDFPWHRVDDLYRCVGLDRNQRRYFLRWLRERGGEVRSVATSEGPVVIAPHFMAQGCIDAGVETGRVLVAVRTAYDIEGAMALKKVVPLHLEFGSDAWFEWMKTAMHRHEGAGPR